jgi:MFS transporter, FSR family, fosmidomycin resistance protein
MNRRALALLSVGHFLIDLCQGIVPALAPFLVEGRGFSKAAAAGLVFAISATSSVVQPVFGQLADRLAMAWLLPASILLTGTALALGAQATSYPAVLLAFGLSGLGVAAFHPEAARKANIASGDRRTTGMSFFSIGGGTGFALAPAITLALMQLRGISGLLVLLYPTAIIAGLFLGRLGLAGLAGLFLGRLDRSHRPAHHQAGAKPSSSNGHDDWRAFRILSGATVLRSIVFYGLNTFLALYFMSRWQQTAVQASRAMVVFLGTSLVGTLLGGWMADRFGRRQVLRVGFTGATVLLAVFLSTPDRTWAMALLVPLAVFLFLPTSVLVVLGQEYLPNRVGLASGVTLGLAVSVGGMCAPLLGLLADRYGMGLVIAILLGLLATAAAQTYALPPVGRHKPGRSLDGLDELLPVTADR